MFGISLSELIVIFLVVLILFGAKSLPEIAKAIGQAVRYFRQEARSFKDAFDETKEGAPSSPSSGPSHEAEPAQPTREISTDFDPNQERREWRPPSQPPNESDFS